MNHRFKTHMVAEMLSNYILYFEDQSCQVIKGASFVYRGVHRFKNDDSEMLRDVSLGFEVAKQKPSKSKLSNFQTLDAKPYFAVLECKLIVERKFVALRLACVRS